MAGGFKLDGAKAMEQRLRSAVEAPDRALARTVEETEVFIEQQVARHKSKDAGGGALNRSIYKKRIPDGWELGHDQQVAPHARFVHWGTRPHVIKPKQDTVQSQVRAHTRNGHPVKAHEREGKKMLRWANGGAFIFARIVKHPGYKGDAWLPRAKAFALDLLRSLFKGR